MEKVVEGEADISLTDAILRQLYLTSKSFGLFKNQKAEFQFQLDKVQMTNIMLWHRDEFSQHIQGWQEGDGESDVESLSSEDEDLDVKNDREKKDYRYLDRAQSI